MFSHGAATYCSPTLSGNTPPALNTRGRYFPRKLFLAGERRPLPPADPGNQTGGAADSRALVTVFPIPAPTTSAVRVAALLFSPFPGFSEYAGASGVPLDKAELRVRNAIERRCSTEKTRREVASFVSAYVAYASQCRYPLTGKAVVFPVTEYLESLWGRGHSVPPYARRALKVFDEILSSDWPIKHPSVMAAANPSHQLTDQPPRERQQAPMLTMDFLLAAEALAADSTRPPGMRYFASAFTLMLLASLRDVDTKVMYDLWVSNTAICGRPRDLETRGMPIMTWEAPLAGIKSEGAWARPVVRSWEDLPRLRGRTGRSSFRFLMIGR